MSSEDKAAAEDVSERILTAEYKDGQLQIVEVIPLERSEDDTVQLSTEGQQLAAGSSTAVPEVQQPRYVQVMDGDKGLLQLDLLNLALLKCGNGESGYRLVTNSKASESDGETDTTITCVLQSSDGEEVDNESYVMVDGEDGPIMFLQSALAQADQDVTSQQQIQDEQPPAKPSPVEILERAKAIQRARVQCLPSSGKKTAGRKRKGSLPSPHELLSSPNFKLYLYSCRACDFKCNAVKELTQHRTSEHCVGGKYRARSAAAMQCPHCPYRANLYSQLESHIVEKHKNVKTDAKTLQCAKCSYQSSLHSQILKHVREKHQTKEADEEPTDNYSNSLFLNSIAAETADILVCGACGFESPSKQDFTQHVIQMHGNNAC